MNSKPLGIIKDSEKELKPLLAKDAPTDEEQQRITELQKSNRRSESFHLQADHRVRMLLRSQRKA